MIYEYQCSVCSHNFDVVKSVAEIDRAEVCEKCDHTATRQFMPQKIYLSKTKVTHAEFHPAFGRVIKNQRDLKYEIDKTGAIEIGNEKPETVHKHFDDAREEKRKKSWESALDDF